MLASAKRKIASLSAPVLSGTLAALDRARASVESLNRLDARISNRPREAREAASRVAAAERRLAIAELAEDAEGMNAARAEIASAAILAPFERDVAQEAHRAAVEAVAEAVHQARAEFQRETSDRLAEAEAAIRHHEEGLWAAMVIRAALRCEPPPPRTLERFRADEFGPWDRPLPPDAEALLAVIAEPSRQIERITRASERRTFA
jgi:hypothetical protein